MTYSLPIHQTTELMTYTTKAGSDDVPEINKPNDVFIKRSLWHKSRQTWLHFVMMYHVIVILLLFKAVHISLHDIVQVLLLNQKNILGKYTWKYIVKYTGKYTGKIYRKSSSQTEPALYNYIVQRQQLQLDLPRRIFAGDSGGSQKMTSVRKDRRTHGRTRM